MNKHKYITTLPKPLPSGDDFTFVQDTTKAENSETAKHSTTETPFPDGKGWGKANMKKSKSKAKSSEIAKDSTTETPFPDGMGWGKANYKVQVSNVNTMIDQNNSLPRAPYEPQKANTGTISQAPSNYEKMWNNSVAPEMKSFIQSNPAIKGVATGGGLVTGSMAIAEGISASICTEAWAAKGAGSAIGQLLVNKDIDVADMVMDATLIPFTSNLIGGALDVNSKGVQILGLNKTVSDFAIDAAGGYIGDKIGGAVFEKSANDLFNIKTSGLSAILKHSALGVENTNISVIKNVGINSFKNLLQNETPMRKAFHTKDYENIATFARKT